MRDPYERSRHERRKERERVARRYAFAGVAFVAALVLLLLFDRMSRDCGLSLFGREAHRRCAPAETWDWLWSAAGMRWMSWTAIVTAVAVAAGWLSRDGE
jgi:hypothetical protein